MVYCTLPQENPSETRARIGLPFEREACCAAGEGADVASATSTAAEEATHGVHGPTEDVLGVGRLLGVGVGTGVWLLLDSLVLFADEYFTREQFQEELTSLVDEQRAGLRMDLSVRANEVRMTTLGPVTPAELQGAD